MYVLDTDTLSNIIKPAPSSRLQNLMASTLPEHMFTSSITVGELLYGAYRSNRRDILLNQMADEIWPVVTILDFDLASAEIYGRLRAELERAGMPLAEADLRIASIAMANDMTLVSGNIRHFSRVPDLRLENWL